MKLQIVSIKVFLFKFQNRISVGDITDLFVNLCQRLNLVVIHVPKRKCFEYRYSRIKKILIKSIRKNGEPRRYTVVQSGF